MTRTFDDTTTDRPETKHSIGALIPVVFFLVLLSLLVFRCGPDLSTEENSRTWPPKRLGS